MPTTTKQHEAAARSAWSALLYVGECWDWTAPRLLREAEKSEARLARELSASFTKPEQLAALCNTALDDYALTDLYHLRPGHQQVAIVAAAMRERRSDAFAAWEREHGDKVRAARAAFNGWSEAAGPTP